MPVLEAASDKLLAELGAARAESDRLFEVLTQDAMYERPIAERHRVIFYLGHLDAFDWIQICREALGQKSRDPGLDDLFQAGIDPDSTDLPKDTAADWPSLRQVSTYVERCRKQVDDSLHGASSDAVEMALEHRLMHLETLAYMFHNFRLNLKRTPRGYRHGVTAGSVRDNPWREIPAGEAILGKPKDGSFGWDNEYEQVRQSTPRFRVQQFPVSNGEYLGFVRDGGTMPHFWSARGDRIFYRGMFEEIPLPLDWPVYATQHDAQSYAKWLGRDLMTESQFDRAAYGALSSDGDRPFPWGPAPPSHGHGNFDFKHWDPESIYATPDGDSSFGVSQLIGNGWEWTSTPFAPFPGFEARASYPGYSANFFDDKHYVLKGGSPRTAARLLRRSFRNWFRRDYPYVYAKFRCVEN